MTKSGKTARKKDSVDATHFFVKELAGESALTRATAETLYDLAGEFYLRRPWNSLADRDLILVEAPDSPERCYCSVVGALGELFSLYVYLGPDGYRLFRRIASGASLTPGDFYAQQRGVSVEFVPSRDLTAADRKLLRALGHPFRRGAVGPIFRAGRPGYHKWYVTEEEGRILALCLEMVIRFCDHRPSQPDAVYWSDEDVYPLVGWKRGKRRQREFQVNVVRAECPPAPPSELPVLDQERIACLREHDYPVRGVLEVDHFYGGGMIGGRFERKTCVRTVLVIDAATGFLLPPVLGTAPDATGDLLVRAVLGAIECGRLIPLDVHVKDSDSVILLGPLARELGFTLKIAESLPALEYAKRQLLKAMEFPGSFSG